MYDFLRKWFSRILLVQRTIRIRLKRYMNITSEGLENIHGQTQIYGREKGTVHLGQRVSTCRGCSLVSVGGRLIIGPYTSFSENCEVVCHERIEIGSHCMFGPNVCIYDHDHRFNTEGIQKGFKTGAIIIESNCWIGANVVILRGTHIGEGCVVGAGTVVKGDIPAHSLVTASRELVIRSIERRR